MKIRGKKIESKNIEYCVIPRSVGEDIVFKCTPVLDLSDFDKLVPEPRAPWKILPGNKRVQDIDSPAYKNMNEKRNEKRISYLIIKSLEATEELEWETVKINDSDTWKNYETELKDSGFSIMEINRIINAVMTANCLNETKLEEARENFLRSLASPEAMISSIPNGEKSNSQSGELVKDLV